MKKILIYYPESKLQPKGGPAGYLYNLKNGLDTLGELEAAGLEISFYNNMPTSIEDNAGLRKRIPKRVLEFRRALNDALFLKKRFPVDESMNEYDIIHFHSAEKMYLCRDFLAQYKGKVILTSHCPCGIYKERIDKLNPFDYKLMKRQIDKLEELDRYAFERADYIIFPCEDAEEPYFNTWPRYASIRKSEKYYYMPTGIVGCTPKVSKAEYRRKYNIPEDAFVVSYAGRHNEIKGYGDLKKIGQELLQEKDIYFLIAGREGPMYRLKNEHWIEVGWTTDPHSLIAASDVFVLPNQETYFDLVLLEVLSLGIPVVMSGTGGNKYFHQFGMDGLKHYSTVEEACEQIRKVKSASVEEISKWRDAIKNLFDANFTVQPFASNYIKILRAIVGDGYEV